MHGVPQERTEPIKINIEDFNKEDWERLKKEWGNTPITVLPSAQPETHDKCTETHSCDCERTETHDWFPVTERLPNHELALVQYSDGDFDLLKFPTAYRRKDIVAWMPLPEPYTKRKE